jgi:hypothetical protein
MNRLVDSLRCEFVHLSDLVCVVRLIAQPTACEQHFDQESDERALCEMQRQTESHEQLIGQLPRNVASAPYDPEMSASRVRRDKAVLSSGCKSHPAKRSSRKQPEQSWR